MYIIEGATTYLGWAVDLGAASIDEGTPAIDTKSCRPSNQKVSKVGHRIKKLVAIAHLTNAGSIGGRPWRPAPLSLNSVHGDPARKIRAHRKSTEGPLHYHVELILARTHASVHPAIPFGIERKGCVCDKNLRKSKPKGILGLIGKICPESSFENKWHSQMRPVPAKSVTAFRTSPISALILLMVTIVASPLRSILCSIECNFSTTMSTLSLIS